MTAGLWVLAVAVAVALGIGGYRAATDGRFRGTHRIRHADDAATTSDDQVPDSAWQWVASAAPEDVAGERATLVQFSSAFCAPCRATRRVLGEVTRMVPGVTHVEIDAEHHLELVRRLGILRTPTTLVLGPEGHEVSRASGVPVTAQVVAAIGQAAQ
ncbi:MAG: thioredoxin family protein [Actinomycetota bacterium]|nr:thioredoxin family protein [Actinomycetota bacterium]